MRRYLLACHQFSFAYTIGNGITDVVGGQSKPIYYSMLFLNRRPIYSTIDYSSPFQPPSFPKAFGCLVDLKPETCKLDSRFAISLTVPNFIHQNSISSLKSPYNGNGEGAYSLLCSRHIVTGDVLELLTHSSVHESALEVRTCIINLGFATIVSKKVLIQELEHQNKGVLVRVGRAVGNFRS